MDNASNNSPELEATKELPEIQKNTPLGDRMKAYEKKDSQLIPPHQSFIVRLDGRSFSKFTSGLVKPFDENFVKAMIRTCNDLLDEFQPSTIYTHSDEITMIFPPLQAHNELFRYDEDGQYNIIANKQHIYNGKYQKIISVFASYCSVRFNFHLVNFINAQKELYTIEFVDKVNRFEQMFDARIVRFDFNTYEIVNHQIWRSCMDCHRNAVSTYARKYFNHKQLQSKSTKEMIEMLSTVGVNWELDVPIHLKYGIYGKKTQYELNDGKNTIRMRNEFKCFKIAFSDEMLRILCSKYWNDNNNSEDVLNGMIEYIC